MKKAVNIFLLICAFILTACQDVSVPATESSNYADSLRAELAGQATPTPVKSEAQSPTPIPAQPQSEQPAPVSVSMYSGRCDLSDLAPCSAAEIGALLAAVAGVVFVVGVFPHLTGTGSAKERAK